MTDSALPLGVSEGRDAFVAAVRSLLLGLPEQGPREVWMVDPEFEAWPLDDDPVLDAFTQWLRPAGRRLHIVAGDFKALALRHPRFSTWRRPWAHALDAWQPLPEEQVQLPALLLAGGSALELLDAARWRARVVSTRPALRALHENVATLLHRCESAWPVTTLGL